MYCLLTENQVLNLNEGEIYYFILIEEEAPLIMKNFAT